MAPLSSTSFSQFPRELRDMIWSAAAAVQYKQSYTGAAYTERQRQAFVGYDNLPNDVEKQPLKLYVQDSHNRDKLRLGVNEFQTLLNHLPAATTCSEARSEAADFCRDQVKLINLIYTVDAPEAPDTSHESSNLGDEILKNVFVQPTTVMVTTATREEAGPLTKFASAQHLVNVVDRVFGGCVEHLILNFWVETRNGLAQIYWPHTEQSEKRREEMYGYNFNDSTDNDRHVVYMTADRGFYANREFYHEGDNEFDMEQIQMHLLKFHEILDAAPHLKSIQLELHTYSWDEELLTRIKAINKDGTLWVNLRDVNIGFSHRFMEAGGRRPPHDGSYSPPQPTSPFSPRSPNSP